MAGLNMDSTFYCCKCGTKGIPIIRKRGSEREAGHLKRLYCLKCKEEWNHVECKEFTHYTHDDFLVEMEYKNFDENGNRVFEYGKLKDLIHKGAIEISVNDVLTERKC